MSSKSLLYINVVNNVYSVTSSYNFAIKHQTQLYITISYTPSQSHLLQHFMYLCFNRALADYFMPNQRQSSAAVRSSNISVAVLYVHPFIRQQLRGEYVAYT